MKRKFLLKLSLPSFYSSGKLLLLVLLSLMSHRLQARFGNLFQAISVSGTVTANMDGEALPGVNVLIKGTNVGTVTGIDGRYNINTPNNDVILVFSSVGFVTEEIPLNSRSVIDVILTEDIQSLSEVVVTALGVEKEKKSLGYAVQEVEGETLEKAREPNIVNSLTGKVAGLDIRNSTDLFRNPSISLRGAEPLIVVDGIPNVDADFWKINADDIENISVLKGATASALYGSIGRNGAIMITTKRGSGQGTKVEINSSTMFQPSFIRIPEVQTTYGNGNNGSYAYINGSGSGTEGGGWIWGPRLDQLDPSTPSGFWETAQFNSPVDPETGELIPLPFLSRGKDNVKNFFQTGMISTNNISVTGGNENGNFRVSASHVYQKGIVPNTDLNNSSFAVSGGYQLAENLKVDASLTYNKQYSDNYPTVGYGPSNYLYNLILWTGADVDTRDLRNYWLEGSEGVQQRHYNLSWYNNPYFQAYEYLSEYNKDNTYGQLTLNYSVAPGFDFMVRSGFNLYGLNESVKEPKSYIVYNDKSRGNYYLTSSNHLDINTDFIASYTKEVNQNLNIRASLGGANRFINSRTMSVNTDGLVVPGFYQLSNSINPLQGSNRLEDEKVNSLYATIDVEFMNSIFLGVTGRNDWVSTLPVENNSFFYPSVSLSTVISDLVQLPSSIAFLKLRASWSSLNDGRISTTDPYGHIEAYNSGVNWNNNPSLFFPGARLNPNISSETSDTYEFGMDLRFFKGRFGIDATYYVAEDYNNIFYIPVSNASGFTSRLENGHEFLRKGVEVILTGTPVKNDVFTWNIGINWSAYRRTLKSIFGGEEALNQVKVGERMDQIFANQYLHTPGGKLIYESNGFPAWDPFARKVGNAGPDWIYGMQNSFSYKDFGLGISVDGRKGGKIYSSTNQKMWWGGTHPGTVNEHRDAANRGEATFVGEGVTVVEGEAQYDEQGNITSDTRVYAPNTQEVNYIAWNTNTSNAYLNHYYDATFLKLREVTLSYQLPSSLMDKTFINNASISLVGRNLLLWSDMPNVDPDPGVDNLQTPSTRNIGFNVNVAF